ncbi:MAG: polyprenyl synthetase family protein [Desulforhopalus sp.]
MAKIVEDDVVMQSTFPSASITAVVKAEADKINYYMREDLARLKSEIDTLLLDVLEYGLFNGGKRIRPLLVVLASRLCGRNDEDAYRLGSAFEYLHAATLFHDDIIDNSSIRRGKESVFQRFGIIEAILAGDFLHAHAMATVGKLSGQKGLDIFCRATTGLVDGEFMQLRNATRHNLSELAYYDVIMGKTGLLIAAACEIGAVYGGGDPQRCRALREYGASLGCAFQIIDDLLDYQGDPEKTGKAVGNDLAEGKITLPLIFAINSANNMDKARLLQIIESSELRASCVGEVCSLISGYGGFDAARKRAAETVETGIAGLSIFTDEDVRLERNVLEGLARLILTREK